MARPFDHLVACDPVLGAFVSGHGPLDEAERRRGRPDDAYGALVRAIVGQQLSVKAARTIYGRLCALYGERTPTPQELIATDPEQLRGVGLSRAKAAYLRDLAEHIEDGELDVDRLPERACTSGRRSTTPPNRDSASGGGWPQPALRRFQRRQRGSRPTSPEEE